MMKARWLAVAALATVAPAWAATPGALDPAFGNAGKMTLAITDTASNGLQLTGLHQLNNGGWLMTGNRKHKTLNRYDSLVARVTAAGGKDTGFSANSYKMLAANLTTTQWQAQAGAFNGTRLLLAGAVISNTTEDQALLMELNPQAVKNTSFATLGELGWKPITGRNSELTHLHLGSSQAWAVGSLGTNTARKTKDIYLQQLLPLSPGSASAPAKIAEVFDLKGHALPLAYTAVGQAGVIAGAYQVVDSAGVGVGASEMLVLRHTAAGKLDTGFNKTGWRRISFEGKRAEAQALLRLKSGKLLVLGCVQNNGTYFAAVQLNANGSLNNSFGQAGRVISSVAGCPIAATELPDGSVRVALNRSAADLSFIRLSPKGEQMEPAMAMVSDADGTASAAVSAATMQQAAASNQAASLASLTASKYGYWVEDALVVASVSGTNINVSRYLFNDDDQDGLLNSEDNCRFVVNPDQADLDNDGLGDVCDEDRDGDGVVNDDDAFPDNPAEWLDTDGDGIGNNADPDDDNDGILDEDDLFPFDPYLINQHTGSANGVQAGSRVLLVADYNADGISDYLVSEPAASVRLNGKLLKKAGRVELRSGASLEPIKVFEGKLAGEQLGMALASWPVTGEALPWLAIGAPQAAVVVPESNKPLKKAGVVRVYQAAETIGVFSETELTASAPAAGSQFGSALAANTERLLIGAPLAAITDSTSGKLLKQAGQVYGTSPDFTRVLLASGSAAKEKFGASLAISDTDNWAAGAPGRTVIHPVTDKKLKNAGGIAVFAADELQWLDGVAVNDQLGGVLAPRFDGETIWVGVPKADVLVGKKRLADAGQVWAIDSGAQPLTNAVLQAQTPVAKQGFGQSITKTAGLLAVGSPLAKNGLLAQAGRVDLYPCEVALCSYAVSVSGQTAKGQFGFSVDVSMDINGDGVQDIAIGQPGVAKKKGQANVYSGAALLDL